MPKDNTMMEIQKYLEKLKEEDIKTLEKNNNHNKNIVNNYLKSEIDLGTNWIETLNILLDKKLKEIEYKNCENYNKILDRFENWISVDSPRYKIPRDKEVNERIQKEYNIFCTYIDFEEEIDFDDYKIISHIEECLEKMNKNKSWLARKTGISRTTIHSIINENTISMENGFKISKVLGKPLDELFEYVKKNENQEIQDNL